MKQLFFILLSVFTFLHSSQAQNLVYKKTAQRGDIFVNNTWKGKDSFLFAYNNDTIQTSLQALQFSANNTWDNLYKYTYTLNATGKVVIQLRENWTAGNWVNSTRYTYTYDGNGNNTEILYDVWNAGSWNPTGKIEYTGHNNYGKYQNEYVSGYSGGSWVYQTWKNRTYVNNQTLTEVEDKYSWNVPTNSWKKWERLYNTYTQGEIGSITRSLPDTAANWAPKDKYIYNYNLAPMQLLEYIAQKYDTLNLNWQNLSRVTYNYTGNNLLDKTQNDVYANFTWNPTARAQYIYNANNEKIEYYTELFNAGNWLKDIRSTYAYSNSLVTSEDQFTGAGNTWAQSKKLSYNYDVNQNLIYELEEDYTGANFTPIDQTYYYYSSYIVNVDDKIKEFSNMTLYPNPANDKITLRFNAQKTTQVQITVVDIYGKSNLLLTQPIFATENYIQIPCASLSNGFYFVHITDLQSGKQQTEKFQVNK